MLRLKDSPYYLEPERKSKTKSKKTGEGDEVHSESSPAASLSSKKEEPTRSKKKSSKIKKEKVLILDEESVEGAADLPQEQITEPSKSQKGRRML